MRLGHDDRPDRRNNAIELLRIVAAFGVVTFHVSHELREVGFAGLIVFLALSPLFAVQSGGRRAQPLWRTYIVPWLFWLPVYGLHNMAWGRPFLADASVSGLLAGTSPHLWYLPFMFVALLALDLALRCRWIWSLWVLAAVGGVVLPALLPALGHLIQPQPPVAQYLSALPAFALGAAGGACLRDGKSCRFIVVAGCAGIALLAAGGMPGAALSYALGMAAVVVALRVPARWTQGWRIRWLSDAMKGVYLIHLLLVYPAGRLVGWGNWPTVVMTFTLSAAMVVVVRRFVRGARIVL